MKKFKYKILGSSSATPVVYEGTVNAIVPKEAIMTALAAEFGDPAKGDTAWEQLADWCDPEDLNLWWDLEPLARRMDLAFDDMSFIVEVSEDESPD